MPRKLRNPKEKFEQISQTTIWVLGDRVLYPEPAEMNSWELFVAPGLDYPGHDRKGCEQVWKSVKEQVLADWIRKFPGSRPSFWWLYDAPRITPESILILGRGSGQARMRPDDFCEPRKRLSGIGTPCHECFNYGVGLDCGIPKHWVDKWFEDYYNGRKKDIHGNPIGTEYHEGDFEGKAIDSSKPPKFESQASCLKRLGLLQPGELQRLKAKDFEPEAVLPESDFTVPADPAIQ